MHELSRRRFLRSATAAGSFTTLGNADTASPVRTVAEIRRRAGVPTLVINGVPTPPLIYYFPIPVKEHIADFYEAGIRIYSWGSSRVIGHCYDMGWVGPNEYDYSVFEREMQTILEAAPECYVFPRLSVSAPGWWLDRHPDEKAVNEREGKTRYRTSMASPLWRREAAQTLDRFIRHARSRPYARHIIGYQLVGGLNEWFYVGSGDTGFPDYSRPARDGFRAWLRETYRGDETQLRRAWNSGPVSFETAEIPTVDQRLKPDVGLLRDPAVSRQVSDFHQFLSETNAEALVELCAAGKRACEGESLMGAFYGYLLNATGGASGGYAAQHWGHQSLRKVLQSPHVDFLCAPYHYTYRGLGGTSTSQGLPESVKLRGKLWITECDNPAFPAPKGVWHMGGPDPTPAQSFAILKRDFSHNLVRRTGMWWMDLYRGGGWYHHPDIRRFLRRCRSLAGRTERLGLGYRGEVAVILDEETPFYIKPGMELLYPLVFLQDKLGLPRIGAPVDYYLHNDLSLDMPDYKLYIFLNTLYLTASERADIKAKVRRGGKVALWMYAPGLISESGLSAANMSDLTGIHLDYRLARTSNHSMCHHLYLTDFEHPITHGLPDGTFFGSDSPINPVVFSTDSEAATLGRLMPSHGMPDAIGEFPAFCIRRFPEWSSVFLGVPNAPAAVLRNIARFAGCHIYNDQDAIIDANGRFLSIHAASGGPKTIRLPRRTNVYDAFNERLVARDTDTFTAELPAYGTKLFWLGDPAPIHDEATRFEL